VPPQKGGAGLQAVKFREPREGSVPLAVVPHPLGADCGAKESALPPLAEVGGGCGGPVPSSEGAGPPSPCFWCRGKAAGVGVVDNQYTTSVREEPVVHINGTPLIRRAGGGRLYVRDNG